MTTANPNAAIDYSTTRIGASEDATLLGVEPTYYGLTLSTWVKITVIGALMALLFRFNLSRLWLKTNPFNGQPNWEHATVIPLIGLYYLYVWREELLRPKALEQSQPARSTLAGLWGVAEVVGLITIALLATLVPTLALRPAAFAGPIPIPWALVAIIALTGALGLAAWFWRDSFYGPSLDRAVPALWRALASWTLLNLVAWGLGFFVYVVSSSAFHYVHYLLVTASLATLYGAVALRDSTALQQWSQRVIAGSASWFGAFVMVWGILFSMWGIWPGQNDFFKDVGMVIALFGVVLLLTSWRIMRIAWFPIVFLFCGLPWPGLIYSWVALPLQHLAAKVAVHVLLACGVSASLQGTKIVMLGYDNVIRTLNVEEACAGLKSLMTFVSVAAAIAFLSARPLWQKVLIVISAVPIAIACNVMRVSGQGLLDRYVSVKWSEGFAHGFAGLVMLIPGFFLILLVCWILDKLFIEELDDEERLKARARLAASQATAAVVAGPAVALVGAPVGRTDGAPVGATKPAALPKVAPAPTKPAAPRSNDRVIQIPRSAPAGQPATSAARNTTNGAVPVAARPAATPGAAAKAASPTAPKTTQTTSPAAGAPGAAARSAPGAVPGAARTPSTAPAKAAPTAPATRPAGAAPASRPAGGATAAPARSASSPGGASAAPARSASSPAGATAAPARSASSPAGAPRAAEAVPQKPVARPKPPAPAPAAKPTAPTPPGPQG